MARVGESHGAPGVSLNGYRWPQSVRRTTEAGQSWPAWVNHTGRQASA